MNRNLEKVMRPWEWKYENRCQDGNRIQAEWIWQCTNDMNVALQYKNNNSLATAQGLLWKIYHKMCLDYVTFLWNTKCNYQNLTLCSASLSLHITRPISDPLFWNPWKLTQIKPQVVCSKKVNSLFHSYILLFLGSLKMSFATTFHMKTSTE